MTYGVKIHTRAVGAEERRFYEELVLRVDAGSFDEAYAKAERYMQDYAREYTNLRGERVRTLRIEATDCFLACDPEVGVQEVYSAFSVNRSALSEAEYYRILTDACDSGDLLPLRDRELN